MVSVDLPPPETPVTQTNLPRGNSAVTFRRLLPVALTTVTDFCHCPTAASRAHRIFLLPERYAPVTEAGFAAISAGSPSADHLPPMHTGPRPDVENIIRFADRFFVMLDHDHRIALIAKVFQRRQQAVIVALMQPD